MLDASMMFSAFAKAPTEQLPKKFALCTVHRAENTDDPQRLKAIFNALNEVAETTAIVLPLHPRTKKYLEKYDITLSDRLITIDPVGYLEMIFLLQHCAFVLTDSGGLQKEAYFFKKYCLTLRDETEWVELIENGFNILVGADYDKIIQAFNGVESQDPNYELDLYGNGEASNRIVEGLLAY